MIPIDYHAHVLPGIDDGSKTVEESLQMLYMEAKQGIGRVAATPHFYAHHDDLDRFLARREEAAAQLRDAMVGKSGLPDVNLGAEVHYYPGMSDSETLFRLTIEGTRSILIEMPPAPWTPQMYRELEWISSKQNLVPILAHLDRYISPLRTYGILQRLDEMPVVVQANASFFLRKTTASFAMKLLRQNRIHVLGSDCHNLSDRLPNMGTAMDAIVRRCGTEILEQIHENENEIWMNSRFAVERF